MLLSITGPRFAHAHISGFKNGRGQPKCLTEDPWSSGTSGVGGIFHFTDLIVNDTIHSVLTCRVKHDDS